MCAASFDGEASSFVVPAGMVVVRVSSWSFGDATDWASGLGEGVFAASFDGEASFSVPLVSVGN